MATPAPERRSNLRRREPAPHEAFADGEYRWGTFDGPIANVNLLDRWSGPARRFHGSRLKEWQAFQLVNDRYFVLGAVMDAASTRRSRPAAAARCASRSATT